MAVVAHVLLVLQLLAILFLKEIDRAIRGRNVPTNLRLLPHVVSQELPQSLAEDHVFEVGNPGEDFLGKCVRNGVHEKRMSGLAVDDALKDMVFPEPNRHKEKLRGECTILSRTKSLLLALLLLGQAPVRCQELHQVGKVDLEAKLDVNVQAPVGAVIYVPEDVSTVSWLLEVGTQMGSMFPGVQGERGEEVLVVAEGARKFRETVLEDFSRSRLVIMDVGLEGRAGHGAVHGFRLQESAQDPRLVGVARGNRAKLPQRFCLA